MQTQHCFPSERCCCPQTVCCCCCSGLGGFGLAVEEIRVPFGWDCFVFPLPLLLPLQLQPRCVRL